MIKIETERLFLQKMTADDFDALYTVLADSDIMKHYPYTFDEVRVQNWIGKISNATVCSASGCGRYVLNPRAV